MSTIKKTTKEDDQVVKETYQDIRAVSYTHLTLPTILLV